MNIVEYPNQTRCKNLPPDWGKVYAQNIFEEIWLRTYVLRVVSLGTKRDRDIKTKMS